MFDRNPDRLLLPLSTDISGTIARIVLAEELEILNITEMRFSMNTVLDAKVAVATMTKKSITIRF